MRETFRTGMIGVSDSGMAGREQHRQLQKSEASFLAAGGTVQASLDAPVLGVLDKE